MSKIICIYDRITNAPVEVEVSDEKREKSLIPLQRMLELAQ